MQASPYSYIAQEKTHRSGIPVGEILDSEEEEKLGDDLRREIIGGEPRSPHTLWWS
jgi:hypothetical protein